MVSLDDASTRPLPTLSPLAPLPPV